MTILQMPVRQLGMMVNGYARASTCGARLFALIDHETEIDDLPDAPDLKITNGTLKLENVSFSYAGNTDLQALSGISFEAHKGETVGIVGPPGSGKTTLMHLLPRFYDPLVGSITIDGQNIRDATLSSVRKAVAVVQQDSFFLRLRSRTTSHTPIPTLRRNKSAVSPSRHNCTTISSACLTNTARL